MKAWHVITVATVTLVFAGCGDGTEENGEYEPAATAVGGPLAGAAETATIGSAGGTLATADGRLTLTIPAGALAQDTEISVLPISNKAHGCVGNAYRIGPDGTTFASPVTLTFKPDSTDLANIGISGLKVAFQNDDMFWEIPAEPVIDTDAGTVSVATTHLSDWSLVQGAVLMPMSTTVKTGQSVMLSVFYCYPADSGDAALAPLGYACTDELAPLVEATDWSVNGQPGGSAATGTVSGSGLHATFTAPADVPSPDTVAVSVRMGGNTLLISNIKIEKEAGDLNGTVDFTFDFIMVPGQTFKAHADLALKMHDDGIDETNYDATGTLEMKEPKEFVMSDMTCTVQDAVKTLNDEYFFKVLKDPPSVRWGYDETWTYHCVGQATYDLTVDLFFFTGTGTGCNTFDDVPVDDIKAPSGTYTTACSGMGNVTAEWTFN